MLRGSVDVRQESFDSVHESFIFGLSEVMSRILEFHNSAISDNLSIPFNSRGGYERFLLTSMQKENWKLDPR